MSVPPAAGAAPAHLPVLDAVRGLAIAAVVLSHGLTELPGAGVLASAPRMIARTGWTGVELFFVLSGFLITRILLASRGLPRYFRHFYVRRALRILPPYYALLAALTIALPWMRDHGTAGSAEALRPLLTATGWLWGHAFNVYIARDWFEAGGRHLPAVAPVVYHLWSLAVEEQFYFVWPAVVLLVPPRRLPGACVGAFLLSAGARAAFAAAGVDPHALYVTTPVHLDGFAIGAWLAAVERGDPARWRAVVARVRWLAAAPWPRLVTALAAFVLIVTVLDPRPWAEGPRVALVALACGALLASALTADATAPLGRLTRTPPLRALGRYSYALYLVHMPVWAALGGDGIAGETAGRHLLRFAAMLVLSGAAAWASWRVIERPALRLKDRWAPSTQRLS